MVELWITKRSSIHILIHKYISHFASFARFHYSYLS